jgi:hypothetical protein
MVPNAEQGQEQSGHPSLTSWKAKLSNISGQKCFILDKIKGKFPQISCMLIHEIVMEQLHK